jgi:hypothetical protein
MSAAVVATVGAVRAISDNDVSPGVLGFLVVAALGVATWLLIRSMNRQIKKIDLPEGGAPIEDGKADGAAGERRKATEPPAASPENEEPGSAER